MILDQSANLTGQQPAVNSVNKPTSINIFLGILPLLLSILVGAVSFFLLQTNLLQAILISFLPLLVGSSSLGIYLFVAKKMNDQNQTITQITTEEKSLTDANTQLEAILQSIQEGMIITDLAGKISLINKSAAQILRRDQQTLQNQPIAQVLLIEDLRGKIVKDYQIELQSPTNTKITVKVSSFPLVSEGQIKGTIYIITDITQEGELAKMKLDFVAQAAHQLRTPLTILKSYLSVFQEKMAGRLNEEEKLYLDRSVIGANQLSELIENLLNVSKIEQRKLELQLAPTQINLLITQAAQQLQSEANTKKITIKQQLAPDLPQILADPRLIDQVLTNLIKNGVEYSKEGGEVVITSTLQGQEITVTVNDNGIGIPSEASASLFTKFFKVTGNLRQESPGIGLGLYNAKSIIEAHHGKIWVNSILGKGSSFGFSLPVTLVANN